MNVSTSRRLAGAAAFGLALAAAAASPFARAQDEQARARAEGDAAPADLETFEQAWRLIHDQFYDRTYHGLDWDAVRVRWLPKAKAAVTRRELHEVLLAMLAELKTSHTALVEPDVYK